MKPKIKPSSSRSASSDHEAAAVGLAEARAHVQPDDALGVARAKAFIQAHVAEPMRLPQVAAAAGLSSASFRRIFRAATGLTSAQFLFDLRVKRAKTLLADFSIPLSEVRKVAGFGSLSQLTRRFRGAAGMSPQQYRTAAQQQRLQRRGEAPSGNRAAPPAKQRTTEENFPQLCGGTRAAGSPPTRCLPRWPRQGE